MAHSVEETGPARRHDAGNGRVAPSRHGSRRAPIPRTATPEIADSDEPDPADPAEKGSPNPRHGAAGRPSPSCTTVVVLPWGQPGTDDVEEAVACRSSRRWCSVAVPSSRPWWDRTCPTTSGTRCRCVSRRWGRPWCPGADVTAACSVVGRDVARDGAALGEALSGLRTTYDAGARRAPGLRRGRGAVGGLERRHPGVPPRPVVRGPAHRAGQPGARAHPPRRDLPRGRAHRRRCRRQPRAGHRRAVLPRAHRRPGPPLHAGAAPGPGDRGDPRRLLRRRRRSAGSAWTGRWPWSPRTVDLGTSVALLREFLDDLDLGEVDVRVWIEGLPRSAASATLLLDDLAR